MKKALITGGAVRLGAHLCETLAKNGWDVVIHYRKSREEAQRVAERCGGKAEILAGDFSTQEGVEAFSRHYLEKYPTTDLLVNNVGNYLVKTALKTSPKEWLDLFQTNFHAPFFLSQALLPSLKAHRGQIVNIGVAGIETRRADVISSAYALSKIALHGLTKMMALELAGDGVRVNMISPGYLENSVNLPKDLTLLPMKRAGTLEEVAHVLLFLIDDKSQYITGQNIEVAGGVRI